MEGIRVEASTSARPSVQYLAPSLTMTTSQGIWHVSVDPLCGPDIDDLERIELHLYKHFREEVGVTKCLRYMTPLLPLHLAVTEVETNDMDYESPTRITLFYSGTREEVISLRSLRSRTLCARVEKTLGERAWEQINI